MENLEEKFKQMHLLSREDRLQLIKELQFLKPDFLKPYVPKWWWWRRCKVKVLLVCDGGLNFDTGGFGLSEFLTTFNQLEATSWVNYEVTLAHRGGIINSPNPVVVGHISNFKFDTSVNLNDFDQVWLFAIQSGGSISDAEIKAIDTYMNGGGGLFATGDHGSLGAAMCSAIPRVKDMRHWADTPNSANDTNEVSMGGRRRNDTNRPGKGDSTSLFFDNQSDNLPQTIGVKQFGDNFLPHPLLSISPRIRPSGIIDIMPDHPHEGECKPERTFRVNNTAISSQIIATSFVLGGSTTNGGNNGKDKTDPHCFPSIAVWDGRPANVGRIVVDSTWHHFVNINLNGAGSGGSDIPGQQSGLTSSDFNVIRHYYMNIATWMSRRRFFLCWRRWIIFDLFKNSQLIEASLNNPVQDIKEISLADLASIGSLAEEVLTSKYNASFARAFLMEMVEETNKNFADSLDVWKPAKEKEDSKSYYHAWLNTDLILYTAIGAGFIALRDHKEIASDDMDEKLLDKIPEVFKGGLDYGFKVSVESLDNHYKSYRKLF